MSIGLIIDEFDNLMYHQEFISMFRSIKHYPDRYYIKVYFQLLKLVRSCYWNI